MLGCMEGVRIIEIGHYVAVPGAGAIMADWGADVIKVEAPETGDPARWVTHLEGGRTSNGINYLFEVANRNKRGITLNLKSEKGKQTLYKMVEGSDVFMSNLQSDNLSSLGLTYDDLSEINPRLVYATLTGYGNKGPKKDKPGYDYAAFWAYGGIMDKTSDPDGVPRRQRPGFGDNITATCIAGGITAALFAREKTGKGQKLSFSLYNTAVWALQADIQVAISTGDELPHGNAEKARNPLWNVYQTKDGRWLEIVMLQADQFWSRFCSALGLEHFEHDPRFDSAKKRAENCETLISNIREAILGKTLADWEVIFEEENLFSSRVQTITEVIHDPQASENDFFVEFDHPTMNQIKLVASPVLFNGIRPPIKRPAPVLGQHTEEVLLELGYTWEDIISFKDEGVI